MKILHTSDWHVGKTLRGRDRSAEFEAVLAEIAGVAEREQVDAVVVAGDVFDTAAPSADAERIVYGALLALAREGRTVVVLSGNHDNDRRLAAVRPLLALGAVHARSGVEREPLRLRSRDGSESMEIAAVPWVAKHHIVKVEELLGMDAAEAEQHYAERVRRIVAHVCEPLDPGAVQILAAHMALPTDDTGEEVRTAHVFDYVVPATVFPSSLHYVALGHYHRRIDVGGACPIRYSGAPMWLGFPRAAHERDPKGVFVVEAHPGVPADTRFVAIEAGRRLRTVRGSLEELEAMAGRFGDDFLRVFVQDQARAGVAKQVREWLPNAVDVTIDPGDAGDDDAPASRRAGRAPGELFREYLTEKNAFDERVVGLFDRLLDEAHATDPA